MCKHDQVVDLRARQSWVGLRVGYGRRTAIFFAC
jgi:hypothetical protein